MTTDISTLQVKVTSSGITQTSTKLDKLAVSGDKAEVAVKKLGTSVVTAGAAMQGAAGGSAALTAAILLLNSNINRLTAGTIQTTSSTRRHTDAMRDAHAAARGLAGSLGALWMTYGSAIPMMAGAAIGLSLKGIMQQGMDLEHVLTGIAVKGEVAAASMGKMREAVLEVGKGVYGPLEVAGALETLVMAGLKVEAAMSALGPALNLAIVGGTTIEKSAYTLVQVGTAMGYTADQFSIVGDVIAKTAATSMSSVESLSEAFKSASSVGVVFGVTLKDLGLSLALLSNLGVQGSAAGTAIKNFYKELDSDAKKVTGTLKKLGVDIDKDLKVGNKFKDVSSVVKVLSEALDKAGDKSGKAMQAFTNERGMRNAAALVQAYRKDVDGLSTAFDLAKEAIDNSAGFVAIGAARMALTSTNQIKSTMNTLKVSFAETFESMAPSVNVFAQEMKRVFQSEGFKNGLKDISREFGALMVAMVRNIPILVDLAKVFLAVKAGMITTAVLQAAAVGFTSIGTAMLAATAGTLTFAAALGPLAIALGVAAAAYAAYAFFKRDALDTAPVQGAIATNSQFIDSLVQEAEKLEIENKHLADNTTAKQAAAGATRELAMEEMKARNAKAIASAEGQYSRAMAGVDLSASEKAKIPGLAAANKTTGLAQVDKAIEAYQNLANAKRQFATDESIAERALDAVESRAQRKELLTEQKFEKEQAAAKARASLAAALAGNPDVAPTPVDAKVTAHISKIKAEALELERLTASYRAKTEATEQMSESGLMMMARTRQAIVETNAAQAGYYSGKEKGAMMALAKEADEAKFAKQKADTIHETSEKFQDIISRGIVQRAAMNIKDYESMGIMEKQAAVTALKTQMTEKETLALRERGREADKQLQFEAALSKLQSATSSSTQRAQGLIDQADSMEKYGVAVKQTALEFADAEIAKLKLTGSAAQADIALRREAAALEDLGKAYLALSKMSQEYSEREVADALASSGGVVGAETAKLMAHQRTTEAMLKSEQQRASAALIVAKAGNNPVAVADAQAVYDKLLNISKKYSAQAAKYNTIDLKVAGLKDVSSMFSGLGKAVAGLGDGMKNFATGIDGIATSLTALAEIEAKQGIDDKERMQGKIGAYGDMAGAAANFFSEGSKGYNTMMGISKVFHAAEMAMGMVRMGQKAIEAVLNQGGGDPYSAFGRMAAMAAIVGALGFAVGGGFSSNKGGKSAEEVQKTQGSGSVFGDGDAKSSSISKSMDRLKENSNAMLPVNQAMLESLRAIQSSMSGLTNLVIRTPGLTQGTNMGIKEGTLSTTADNKLLGVGLNAATGAAMGMMIGGPLGALLLGGLSAIGAKIAQLWGSTKQSIVDSGLSFGGKVSTLQGGSGFNQYASVDTTKKSWFGLSKNTTNSVQTQGLNNELSQQFGLIFTGLEETLKLAAGPLGKSATEVGNAIDSMVLSTSTISLKDLKGEALTEAINGVISKAMDEIAERAYPAMAGFRRVGEGYAETVIRVASSVESAELAMSQMGIKSIKYTDIVNKQGDVAAEMVKQSLAAAEGMSGVNDMLQGMGGTMDELVNAYKSLDAIRKQMNSVGLNGKGLNVNVVKGAGGVSQLGSALNSYKSSFFTDAEKSAIMLKSLTADFKALGLALPSSKAAFRDLVEKTGVSTEATAKLTGQLLGLSEAYATATEANEAAGKKATDGLTSTIDALKKFGDSLKSFKSSLLQGALSDLTPSEKFLQAKKEYESIVLKAMSGDTYARERVTESATSYLEASRVVNASDSNYSASFSQVLNDIDRLSALTGTELSDAEKQLEALNKQNESLSQLNVTAEGILAGIQGSNLIPVAALPTIEVGKVDEAAAEIAQLRADLALANEKNAKQMEDLMGVVYDAQVKGAGTIGEMVNHAVNSAVWATKNSKFDDIER